MTHQTYFKPKRSKKAWREKDFSPYMKDKIVLRDKVCQVCNRHNPPHDVQHIFSRGRLYRDTVNWIENGVLVCRECHHRLTHPKADQDKYDDLALHLLALDRFKANKKTPKEDIKEMIVLINARFYDMCDCGIDRAEKYVDAAVHSSKCKSRNP